MVAQNQNCFLQFGFYLGILGLMIQRVSTPVSVAFVFDHKARQMIPKTIWWEGKTYQIIKLGFHHTYRQGRTLYHVFSVESPTLFFRVVLNTETLVWTLEEIADGEPD